MFRLDYIDKIQFKVNEVKINEEFYKRAFSYLISDVIDRNLKKSFKMFKKLAEQDDPKSQYRLGRMYIEGLGVEKDDEKAKNYFIKSFYTLSRLAEEGDSESQYYLSLMFYNGYGCKKNLKKSFEWYKKSAEQGFDEAQSWVGWCYGMAVGVQQDKEKAFEWCKKSAEQGNPKGQCQLAELYQFEGDYEKAFYWNLKAAKQGNLWASFSIFSTTPQAIGAREQPSLKTLINSYRLSANFDLEDADFLELLEFAYLALDGGTLLSNGQDYDLRGNYFLGESFFYGDFGVHQNYEMAFKWYLKAADLGYGDAQLAIADMYYEGKGTTKDYVKAFEYYSKSVEQGEERAQYNLGVMYLKGEGVKSNKVKAFEYIEKSSENNYKNAKTALDILSKLKESNQDDNIEFFKEISVNPISSRWW